jgi:hypothetical protein
MISIHSARSRLEIALLANQATSLACPFDSSSFDGRLRAPWPTRDLPNGAASGASDAADLDEAVFRYLCSCSLGWEGMDKAAQEP